MLTPRHAARSVQGKHEERAFFASDGHHRSASTPNPLSHPLLGGDEPANGRRVGAHGMYVSYLKTGEDSPVIENSYSHPGTAYCARSLAACCVLQMVKKKCSATKWMATATCAVVVVMVTLFVTNLGSSSVPHGAPARGHFTAIISDMLSHSMYDSGIEVRGSGTFPEFVHAHPVAPRVGDVSDSEAGKPGAVQLAQIQGGTDGIARAMTALLHGQCYRGRGLVLDIGSDYGYYALLAASHGCRAKAIDVVCWKHDFLEFSRRLNGLYNVEPMCALVGQQDPRFDSANELPVMGLHSIVHEDVLMMKLDVGTMAWDVISSSLEVFEDFNVRHLLITMPPLTSYKEETVSLLKWARVNNYVVRDVPHTVAMDSFQRDRYPRHRKPHVPRSKPDHTEPPPKSEEPKPVKGEEKASEVEGDGEGDEEAKPVEAEGEGEKDALQSVPQAQAALQKEVAHFEGDAAAADADAGEQDAEVGNSENVAQGDAAVDPAAEQQKDGSTPKHQILLAKRALSGESQVDKGAAVSLLEVDAEEGAAANYDVAQAENNAAEPLKDNKGVAVDAAAPQSEQGAAKQLKKEDVLSLVAAQFDKAAAERIKKEGAAAAADILASQAEQREAVLNLVAAQVDKAVAEQSENQGAAADEKLAAVNDASDAGQAEPKKDDSAEAKPAAAQPDQSATAEQRNDDKGAAANPAAAQADQGAAEQQSGETAVPQVNVVAGGTASMATPWSKFLSSARGLLDDSGAADDEAAYGAKRARRGKRAHAAMSVGHKTVSREEEAAYYERVMEDTMRMRTVPTDEYAIEVVKDLIDEDIARLAKGGEGGHSAPHQRIFLFSKRN